MSECCLCLRSRVRANVSVGMRNANLRDHLDSPKIANEKIFCHYLFMLILLFEFVQVF